MIGIFDSGYGGLTIMKEVVQRLPRYDYLYLGDNARAPYGNRSREAVFSFTEQAVKYLFAQECRLIIIACFTASAMALRELQEKYLRNPNSLYKNRKILGVVRPVVEQAAHISRFGNIGVIGTRGTVHSGAFELELKKQKVNLRVVQQACPLLVPFIEEGWHTRPEALYILKKYLRPLKTHNIDTLLLGCTHYPLMIKDIRRIMGKNVTVLDSGKIVAESLVEYLKRHSEIEKQLSKEGKRSFQTTDDPERFKEFLKRFAGMQIGKVERVNL